MTEPVTTPTTTTGRLRAIAVHHYREPPWYVRLVGLGLMGFSAWWWWQEKTPITLLEFAKHGGILLVGLRLFYPEGARDTLRLVRRTPFFDRRSGPR